jgi:hypothetical protein
MNVLPPDYLHAHFRKKNFRGRSEITLDREMYHLFFAIEEAKPMAEILHESGLSPDTARNALARLLSLDLIEIVEKRAAFAGGAFIETLNTHFIKAIGPLGSFLLEEALPPDKQGVNVMSAGEASELVLRLSAEIQDPRQREAFKKAMITCIMESGS